MRDEPEVQMTSARPRIGATALHLLIALQLVGCSSDGRELRSIEAGHGTRTLACSVVSASGYAPSDSAPYVGSGVLPLVADYAVVDDLNCDNLQDTVAVGRVRWNGKSVFGVVLAISDAGLRYRFVETLVSGEPAALWPALIADIDGDGTKDLVLQLSDDDQQSTLVGVLMRPRGLVELRSALVEDVDISGGAVECARLSAPYTNVDTGGTGVLLVLPSHRLPTEPPSECSFVPRAFRVVADSLTSVRPG